MGASAAPAEARISPTASGCVSVSTSSASPPGPPDELADPLPPAARTSAACARVGAHARDAQPLGELRRARRVVVEPVVPRALESTAPARPGSSAELDAPEGRGRSDPTPRAGGRRGKAAPGGRRSQATSRSFCALGQRLELLQALVLDLADALARDVERAPHLVERARVLAVEAVAHLEDARSRSESVWRTRGERLLAERGLDRLVGCGRALVGEEVPELGLLLVADRLLQRDRRLRAPLDVLDLVGLELELQGDLLDGRLAAELAEQLALDPADLVQLLDDVHGHADRARLVRERPGDRLADPPGRVGRELEALAVVELLRRADEPDRALLDQVEEGQALVAVVLRDRDDEPRFDSTIFCLAAWSPRSMRLASSTSCAAVSRGTLPMSLRKSWSASVEISRASGSRSTSARPRRRRRPRCGAPRAPSRTRPAARARTRRRGRARSPRA